MKICTGKSLLLRHDEIAHEDGPCPLCALMQEKMNIEDKLEELHKMVDDLEEQIRELS